MNKLYAAIAGGAFAAVIAGPASGADQLALAQKSGCTACHSVDRKIVGPAFKNVAAKYRGDKGAEARLIKKVEDGGSGVWGQIPMPPNTQVKPEDVKKLVEWVLSLK